MALPDFTMRQLLEAGVHFGHHTRRWNPKMSPYIFGIRNGIHIVDLEQSVPLLRQGLEAIREVVAGGGRVLMVGTKRQAQEAITEAAKRCGQYYVNYRWLGGMLTNFKTISQSIKRLREVDERIAAEESGLTKRELLTLTRDRDKLERALGGIAYPIPGNDDAMRAIHLYCDLVASAVLDGLQAELSAAGVDVGARAQLPAQLVPEEPEGDESLDVSLDQSLADTAGSEPGDAEATPAVEVEATPAVEVEAPPAVEAEAPPT